MSILIYVFGTAVFLGIGLPLFCRLIDKIIDFFYDDKID